MQDAIEHLKTRYHKHRWVHWFNLIFRVRRYIIENCKDPKRTEEMKKERKLRKERWWELTLLVIFRQARKAARRKEKRKERKKEMLVGQLRYSWDIEEPKWRGDSKEKTEVPREEGSASGKKGCCCKEWRTSSLVFYYIIFVVGYNISLHILFGPFPHSVFVQVYWNGKTAVFIRCGSSSIRCESTYYCFFCSNSIFKLPTEIIFKAFTSYGLPIARWQVGFFYCLWYVWDIKNRNMKRLSHWNLLYKNERLK